MQSRHPQAPRAIAITQTAAPRKRWYKTLEFALAAATGAAIALLAAMPKASALENIELNYGSMFKLDLPITELEAFVETGEASDNLQLLLDLGQVEISQAQQLLSEELAVDSTLTERMLESYLGEVLLKDMASVVNPGNGREPWQDIRTAMVSASSDETLSALEVLKSYGPETLSIDGEKAMVIFGRLQSDFGDIQQILGVRSLKDLTHANCEPKN